MIRPNEAAEVLEDFLDSEDEDITDAAQEALALAGGIGEFESFKDDGQNGNIYDET